MSKPSQIRPGAQPFIGQLLAIWKDPGPTSHDIVNAVRRITGERRVGHAGTLDPFASGILVIGIGRQATRQLAQITHSNKEYHAKVHLGATSTTEDRTGAITETTSTYEIPTLAQIEAAAANLRGPIKQRPPAFSAIKVAGRPAYKSARKGKMLDLGLRDVEIYELEILSYSWPFLDLRTVTSAGTYIRSLARDLGEALSTGGYLETLERSRIGDWTRAKSLTLQDLQAQVTAHARREANRSETQ